MNKYLNNNIYRICFSFCFFFWDTPFPISNSTVFVSAFYCIPKTCTNTVLSSTVFIPAIRYPVSVYGTGWYRNDVQNGTVWYLSNTVYREYGIGTVPVSTVQQYWNGTVQYRNVYWVGPRDISNHHGHRIAYMEDKQVIVFYEEGF